MLRHYVNTVDIRVDTNCIIFNQVIKQVLNLKHKTAIDIVYSVVLCQRQNITPCHIRSQFCGSLNEARLTF